jgi:arabinogalactan endo-1,4-beta-galactosidase
VHGRCARIHETDGRRWYVENDMTDTIRKVKFDIIGVSWDFLWKKALEDLDAKLEKV